MRLGRRRDGRVIIGCIGRRRPRAEERPVGLERAIRFECVHLPPDVLQTGLQRRGARLGQVRQIGVGRGQRHLLPANLGAGALERLPANPDLLVVGRDPLPQRRNLLVDLHDLPPERIELLDVGVELPFAAGHLLQNAASVGAGALVVGLAPRDPLAQLVGLVIEPPHVRCKRRGALGHGRMPRSGVGGVLPQGLDRLTGVVQAALGLHETLVGRSLVRPQPFYRLARLRLPRLEGASLLRQLPAFDLDHALPVRNPRPLVVEPRQLHVEADELLLQRVLVVLQRAERVFDPHRAGLVRLDLAAEPLDRFSLAADPFAQLLDLPLRTEQSRSAPAAATGETARSPQDDALRRRDRVLRRACRGRRHFDGRRDPPLPQQPPHRGLAGAGHPHDVRQSPQRGMRRIVGAGRRRVVGDEEAATPHVARGGQRRTGERVPARRHDHVLQNVRQTGLDRRFVRPLDLEMVGHRSMMGDLAAGSEDLSRGFAVRGAPGLDLLERLDARARHRHLLLASPQIARTGLDRNAGGCELRLPLGPRGMHGRQPLTPLAASRFRRRPRPADAVGLRLEIGRFRIRLRQGFGDSTVDRGGVVDDVLQRGRRVHCREHLAASGFDISLPPLDRPLTFRQCPFGILQPLERRVAIDDASPVRRPLRLQLFSERAAARLERSQRSGPLLDGLRKLRRAALAELDPLLMPLDLDFASMRRLAKRRRRAVGLGQLQAQALPAALQRRQGGCRSPFCFSRLVQPLGGGLDGVLEQAAPAREVHALPPPQLFAQPAIPACLGSLSLECAALLLHLEDDVVDARQVLLRGLELQLRRTAPGPVLGDTRRLLEQLPALGGPCAQDLADPPLLYDRIGLHSESRVHQEILNVAEPADPPVDEILALPRPVQPPGHLDVAADGRLRPDRRPHREGAPDPAPPATAWPPRAGAAPHPSDAPCRCHAPCRRRARRRCRSRPEAGRRRRAARWRRSPGRPSPRRAECEPPQPRSDAGHHCR